MVFSEKTKFITDRRFAELEPLDVYDLGKAGNNYCHPEELKNIHIKVRKCFSLGKSREKRYMLRFSAADYAKVYLNGKRIGQGPAPGYTFCYYWNEYDVTDAVCDGENTIEAEVYYQGHINRVWNSGDLRFGFICELRVDGVAEMWTDESWEYTVEKCFTVQKVIGYDTQNMENYDSRIKDGEYLPVAVNERIDYVYSSEPTGNLDIYHVKPVLVEKLKGGALFLDFGKEITGTVEITAEGKSGDVLRVLCGEESDGSEYKVRYDMRCNCLYEQLWTLADGECKFREFDYKAFRYVALVPADGAEISIKDVSVLVRHYPMPDGACVLHTDNEILKAVWELCKNGVRCGSQEVFVDCPSREKGQYAGDLTVTSASQIYLTGDLKLFRKALDNQLQSSFICPGIMATTPGSVRCEIADYSLQLPILALRHYEFTGDKEYLRENLRICRGMLDYFRKYERDDGLLDGVTGKWNLVDWPKNLRDNYDFPLTEPIGKGVHNVINAFYVGANMQIEKICDILGESYEPRAKKLAEAFNRVFFDCESGLYNDSETSKHNALHSNVLPLYYGFSPKEAEQGICDYLMRRGFVCGVYYSYFMMKGLCRAGRELDAYSLIVSEDENSWYNMVREGGTA
ncbi:MAG: family 78 glycoside hydrolase catalytic domain, partial [Clostridia bacterium]|nr:family 78 glycoside hydrolase catalytic domain [Clostridia bacterium]